jgi:hypothetical protein
MYIKQSVAGRRLTPTTNKFELCNKLPGPELPDLCIIKKITQWKKFGLSPVVPADSDAV